MRGISKKIMLIISVFLITASFAHSDNIQKNETTKSGPSSVYQYTKNKTNKSLHYIGKKSKEAGHWVKQKWVKYNVSSKINKGYETAKNETVKSIKKTTNMFKKGWYWFSSIFEHKK